MVWLLIQWKRSFDKNKKKTKEKNKKMFFSPLNNNHHVLTTTKVRRPNRSFLNIYNIKAITYPLWSINIECIERHSESLSVLNIFWKWYICYYKSLRFRKIDKKLKTEMREPKKKKKKRRKKFCEMFNNVRIKTSPKRLRTKGILLNYIDAEKWELRILEQRFLPFLCSSLHSQW